MRTFLCVLLMIFAGSLSNAQKPNTASAIHSSPIQLLKDNVWTKIVTEQSDGRFECDGMELFNQPHFGSQSAAWPR